MMKYNDENVKGISIKVIGKIIGGQEKVVGKFWYNKKMNEVVADTKTDLMSRVKKIIG